MTRKEFSELIENNDDGKLMAEYRFFEYPITLHGKVSGIIDDCKSDYKELSIRKDKKSASLTLSFFDDFIKKELVFKSNEHVFFYDESDDGNIQIAITTIVKRECETPAFKGLFFGNIRKNETE